MYVSYMQQFIKTPNFQNPDHFAIVTKIGQIRFWWISNYSYFLYCSFSICLFFYIFLFNVEQQILHGLILLRCIIIDQSLALNQQCLKENHELVLDYLERLFFSLLSSWYNSALPSIELFLPSNSSCRRSATDFSWFVQMAKRLLLGAKEATK